MNKVPENPVFVTNMTDSDEVCNSKTYEDFHFWSIVFICLFIYILCWKPFKAADDNDVLGFGAV
jgi:hypothetical protein